MKIFFSFVKNMVMLFFMQHHVNSFTQTSYTT